MGFRALGRGRALEGESEGGSERERERVHVRERGRERDLVLIVVGPKTNTTGSTGLTGCPSRSDRSGPADRKKISSEGLSLKFETNSYD